MNKIFYLSIIFCFIIAGKIFSQSDSIPDLKLDSLLTLVENVESKDTTYIDNLMEVGSYYQKKYDYGNAKLYFLEAEELASKMEEDARLIHIYFLLTRSKLETNKYNQVIRSLQSYTKDLSNFNDKTLYDFMNVGIELNWRKRYSEALDLIFHIENEYKKRPNSEKHVSKLLAVKREVFVEMKDFEMAKVTSDEALKYAEISGDMESIAIAEIASCWQFMDLKKYDKATEGYLRLLQDSSKTEILSKESLYAGLNEAAFLDEKFEASINYANEAIKHSTNPAHRTFLKLGTIKAKLRLGNHFNLINEFNNLEKKVVEIKHESLLSEFYYQKGEFLSEYKRYDEAIIELNKSLFHIQSLKAVGYQTEDLVRLIESLIKTNVALGNYEQAFEHQQSLLTEKQKIIDEESALKGMRFAAKQVLEKSQNEQVLLQKQNQIQQKLLWGAGIAAFLFLIFGAVIWNQSKQLSKEKKKSEDLLFNMLPVSIAHRMQKGELSIADKYKEATVIFIDMANFTKISASQPAEEILQLLNIVFSKIDQLTEQFHLEKIKTIGDCYMAVSGIPEFSDDHLTNAVEFCFAILEEFKGMKYQGYPIDFRIGVETGPVVAGVIGEKRFLFDLWGDTVNTASRMEAHGVLGKIQTTRNVYNKIKSKYNFDSRGLVKIKGKGQMEVFVLENKK
ncbi:MAG: adenylate/guanylate cyclase domain-containing protein [Saprospiraceae bacterium]